MNFISTPLTGLYIIEPQVFHDHRGYFYQSFQQKMYTDLGLPPFIQDNISHSKQHILRGLHYQFPHAQGKLVSVIHGEVFDVAVDIRLNSQTFGQWFSIILSDQNHKQLYIPPGFAHGFCVLSKEADFHYKCTDFYAPKAEHGIAWDDPKINIKWPILKPILSEKDANFPLLSEISDEYLPHIDSP